MVVNWLTFQGTLLEYCRLWDTTPDVELFSEKSRSGGHDYIGPKDLEQFLIHDLLCPTIGRRKYVNTNLQLIPNHHVIGRYILIKNHINLLSCNCLKRDESSEWRSEWFHSWFRSRSQEQGKLRSIESCWKFLVRTIYGINLVHW